MKKISIIEFTELLNKRTASFPRYSVIIRDGVRIISNVPKALYMSNLLEYNVIGEANDVGFDKLREYINQAKAILQCFNDNDCVPNAYNLFNLVKETGLFEKNQIYLGYISYEIPEQIDFVGKAISLESSIRLEEWHAYNLVNDLLVDISIYSNFRYPGQAVVVSGKADEYTYINPPAHLTYFGLSFNTPEDFLRAIETTYGIKIKR